MTIPKSISGDVKIMSALNRTEMIMCRIPISSRLNVERADLTDEMNVARVDEEEIMSEKRSLVGSSSLHVHELEFK